MTAVIIVDIDGPLSNNDHRRNFVEKPVGEKDWESFFADLSKDTLNQSVDSVMAGMSEIGVKSVLATGRGEEYREPTEAWLNCHDVEYDKLYMRPAGNRRPDTIVKRELLD